ncbi:MAG: NAD(P)H-binding protein [Chloroflexota bacterium]
MKKIVVLGATGFLGQNLVKRLLDREYDVRVLVRNTANVSHLSAFDKVEVIQGAYFDKERLKDVVANSDAVMTTIAPKPMSNVSDNEMRQYKASFVELINVLETLKVDRFVHIAGSTIRFRNEKLSFRRKVLRFVLTTIARSAVCLKDFELQTMEQRNLNWISIRSPRIFEGIKGSLVADARNMPGGKVDVVQLADFLIDQLETNDWMRKAPFVSTK